MRRQCLVRNMNMQVGNVKSVSTPWRCLPAKLKHWIQTLLLFLPSSPMSAYMNVHGVCGSAKHNYTAS